MVQTIGIIGLALLALAWIPQTYSIIKKRRSYINPKFGILYVIGSLILVYYSIQINDIIFLILNSFVALMSAISLYFSTGKRKK
jgi:lipid-A-disaccharide synthase-like uncharacterized protein|tara:strand:+ start:580 stop:831 length:252 start_codon:yes stop_codon:yes gene_type:complete